MMQINTRIHTAYTTVAVTCCAAVAEMPIDKDTYCYRCVRILLYMWHGQAPQRQDPFHSAKTVRC